VSGVQVAGRTDELELRVVHVSAMDNCAYLLTCRATGAQLLVDAADDAPSLLSMVASGSPRGRLDGVVTTHRHWDHHRALPEVVEATGAWTAAGAEDADHLPVRVDRRLDHGDVVHCGDVPLEVVRLRGHTPGSVALVHRSAAGPVYVLTGDSLFPGGVGNTGGDTDRFRSLLDDVEARLFAVLPDEAVVLPGHGAPTTIGAERPSLSSWRARGW
jgi:glyoxylase-like metal-dependent hydrolase (beta-lactamase superfamily II)